MWVLDNEVVYFLEDCREAHFLFVNREHFEVVCQRSHVREKLDFACATYNDIHGLEAHDHCASLKRIFLDFDFRSGKEPLGNVYRSVEFPCPIDIGYEDLGSLQISLQFVNELLKLCIVDKASLLLFYFRYGNGM